MRLIGLVILASSLTLASAAGEAQPSTTIPRIGLLADSTSWEPLRLGLRDLGYVEGKSFALEERSSQGRNERFSALASELVRLNVNIIVTWGTPATLAAKAMLGTLRSWLDPVIPGRGCDVCTLDRPFGSMLAGRSCTSSVSTRRRSGSARSVPRPSARVDAALICATLSKVQVG